MEPGNLGKPITGKEVPRKANPCFPNVDAAPQTEQPQLTAALPAGAKNSSPGPMAHLHCHQYGRDAAGIPVAVKGDSIP